ncbi:hypothetical protein SAMN04487916_12219 [Arthrobacter sp. ov407]|nr:hypothetical protein SAMN04487916_12219 [Arthrobacter sp. ov407]
MKPSASCWRLIKVARFRGSGLPLSRTFGGREPTVLTSVSPAASARGPSCKWALSNERVKAGSRLDFPNNTCRGITCTSTSPGSCPSRWRLSPAPPPSCRVLPDRPGHTHVCSRMPIEVKDWHFPQQIGEVRSCACDVSGTQCAAVSSMLSLAEQESGSSEVLLVVFIYTEIRPVAKRGVEIILRLLSDPSTTRVRTKEKPSASAADSEALACLARKWLSAMSIGPDLTATRISLRHPTAVVPRVLARILRHEGHDSHAVGPSPRRYKPRAALTPL